VIRPAQLLRLGHIIRVLLRHGVDEFVEGTRVHPPLRLLKTMLLVGASSREDSPRGQRVRESLQELGPIFVKFGQTLSTRRDLLPRDVADELAKLQDDVPPFDPAAARETLESVYGKPLEQVFDRFDSEPMAAASIAQCHGARLTDGREAVLKILRPGVRKQIRRDLDLMYAMARLVLRLWPDYRQLRPVEVVAEYEKVILDELDLMREAAAASQLRRNFEGSKLLYIPEVYWDYCRPDVLVTERIHGIPIGDVHTLRDRGVDMATLAARGVEIFFTQVFKHNFFHADMHPGNIFVDATEPTNPSYIAVDFGIVGSLDPRDQQYLAENFLAFFQRDYQRVAKLHVNSGWVPRDTRLDEVESAFRTVCEPIFNRPLSEISFGQFLVRLFTVARRFGMEVQPQLILLQKTLLNIEGLGRELYPDLDLWKTAHPILEEWMEERVSGRAIISRLREQLPSVGESLQEFPQVIHSLLQQASDGQLEIRVRTAGLDELRRDNRELASRRSVGLAGTAVLIAAAILVGLGAEPTWLGWVGAVAGVWLLFRSRS
jgi:ubiquinone biosynthesis protein